jgi:hypothetical protein
MDLSFRRNRLFALLVHIVLLRRLHLLCVLLELSLLASEIPTTRHACLALRVRFAAVQDLQHQLVCARLARIVTQVLQLRLQLCAPLVSRVPPAALRLWHAQVDIIKPTLVAALASLYLPGSTLMRTPRCSYSALWDIIVPLVRPMAIPMRVRLAHTDHEYSWSLSRTAHLPLVVTTLPLLVSKTPLSCVKLDSLVSVKRPVLLQLMG